MPLIISTVLGNNTSEKISFPTSILERLKLYDIKPRKGLGQNFLINQGSLMKIVEAADLSSEDLVIEAGPGLGILTTELAKKAGEVLAVEIDDKLVSILKQLFTSAGHVKIIKANILDTPPDKLIQQYASQFNRRKGYKVVANIPYYITSPIIRHFLEAPLKPSLMVLLVQKEVGHQITSGPIKTNLLNLSVQLYSRPTLVAKIPAGNFYPRPKVDSVILRLDVFDKPRVHEEEIQDFFYVTRAGFSAPRKQIKNSLAQGLRIKVPEAIEMLDKSGISPERRPQTLSLEEWAQIKDAFIQGRDKLEQYENKSTS